MSLAVTFLRIVSLWRLRLRSDRARGCLAGDAAFRPTAGLPRRPPRPRRFNAAILAARRAAKSCGVPLAPEPAPAPAPEPLFSPSSLSPLAPGEGKGTPGRGGGTPGLGGGTSSSPSSLLLRPSDFSSSAPSSMPPKDSAKASASCAHRRQHVTARQPHPHGFADTYVAATAIGLAGVCWLCALALLLLLLLLALLASAGWRVGIRVLATSRCERVSQPNYAQPHTTYSHDASPGFGNVRLGFGLQLQLVVVLIEVDGLCIQPAPQQ